MKKLICAFVVLIFSLESFTQGIDEWANSKKPLLYEKVYAHTDREFYNPGDTIWFKTYLVSGITNKPIQGYKNIYVQLVSPGGLVTASRLLMSINGEANGDIALPDSLPAAQYCLRIFTRYLKNFGEKSYFHKPLFVSKKEDSSDFDNEANGDSSKISAMFFPEGGNLVLNAANHVALKVIGKDGRGIKASGKIVDNNGETVTNFNTTFLGMGKFVFMPVEGKTYHAKIDGYDKLKFSLDKIAENGIAIDFQDAGVEVMVSLARNFKVQAKQTYFVAASHKGVVLFHQKVEMDGFSQAVRISKNLFPLGISKITIFDLDLNIIAERLVFIGNNFAESLKIIPDKDKFLTREKVGLKLELLLDTEDTIASTLSVSVADEDFFSAGGRTQTIESYLLLDSELKGIIESPAQYFIGDSVLSSLEKLDLLMMVQGWRSYYWDEIEKNAPEDLNGWDDAGLTVEGMVKRLLVNKPVAGGRIVLGPFSRFLLFEETKTDQNGRFKFDRLYIRDTSQVILNAKNERDRANTEIIPDPAPPRDTIAPITDIRKTIYDAGIPLSFYRKNYLKHLAEQEYIPDKNDILLHEVKVYAPKPEQFDGHVRLYPEPDKSLTVTENDYTYSSIFEYLEGRVAGVTVTGESISIRGGGTPLFVLDGVICQYPEDMIYPMHMQDIDKIEILKSGASTSYYGSKGGNGVIAIYTRHGDNKAVLNQYIKGRIILKLNGFQKPNQFYSPKYTPENIKVDNLDFRATLFWSPSVAVKDGKAEVEFYTSDNLANYMIIVEGVSNNGRIITGINRFSVTETNKARK